MMLYAIWFILIFEKYSNFRDQVLHKAEKLNLSCFLGVHQFGEQKSICDIKLVLEFTNYLNKWVTFSFHSSVIIEQVSFQLSRDQTIK